MEPRLIVSLIKYTNYYHAGMMLILKVKGGRKQGPKQFKESCRNIQFVLCVQCTMHIALANTMLTAYSKAFHHCARECGTLWIQEIEVHTAPVTSQLFTM